MIGKQLNKSLLPEEKLYVGYHLSKVRPYVTKIYDLNMSKTVLDGNYSYDKPEFTERKSFGSPPRGGFRGRGDSVRGSGFKRGLDNKRGGGFNRSSGGGSGYRGSNSGFRGSGSGFRGSGGGFQKSFNHYGAY